MWDLVNKSFPIFLQKIPRLFPLLIGSQTSATLQYKNCSSATPCTHLKAEKCQKCGELVKILRKSDLKASRAFRLRHNLGNRLLAASLTKNTWGKQVNKENFILLVLYILMASGSRGSCACPGFIVLNTSTFQVSQFLGPFRVGSDYRERFTCLKP